MRRWFLVILIAGGFAYVTSFIVLRYEVLPGFEMSKYPAQHWLRPAYERIYYPLRLLSANGWSPVPRTPDTRVGTLLEVTEKRIVFPYGDGGSTSIGFACIPSACTELKRVNVGDEVEAIFGATLVNGHDSFINNLLSVRLCSLNQQKCIEGRETQRIKEQKHERILEEARQKDNLCFDTMQRTLANDPRYVPQSKLDAADDQKLTDRYNALVKEKRICLESVIESHERAVFESCTLHKCGDNVGGGCWHISGYSVHSAVLAKAVEKCTP